MYMSFKFLGPKVECDIFSGPSLLIYRIAAEHSIFLSGFNKKDTVRMVEQYPFVLFLCFFRLIQFLINSGQPEKSVIGKNIIGIELDDFKIIGFSFGRITYFLINFTLFKPNFIF